MKKANKVRLIFAGAAVVAALSRTKNIGDILNTGAYNKVTETNVETTTTQQLYTLEEMKVMREEMRNGNERNLVNTYDAIQKDFGELNQSNEVQNETAVLSNGITSGSDTSTIQTNDNSEELNRFIEQANESSVNYVYASYYNIDEAISRTGAEYINTYDSLICSIEEIPTEDMIYRTILANNSTYFSRSRTGYYELSESELKTVASLAAQTIKDNYYKLSEESKIRIYEELAHLTVIGADSSNRSVSNQIFNASYKDNGQLLLDTNMIGKYVQKDAFERTVLHELDHLLQREYNDGTNEIIRIGTSVYDNSLSVNPLIWSFVNETTAESESMKQTNNNDPLVYSKQFPYLRLLDLTALVSPSYGERAFEQANMNCSQEDMYKMFNATTYEEKVEVIKMLYSLDIVLSDRSDFNYAYRGTDGKEQVNQSLLSSSLYTNSRYFYTSLAERVENSPTITLNDCYYLIKLHEIEINSCLHLDDDAQYYTQFVDSYSALQTNFFTYLAGKYNTDYNTIKATYEEYCNGNSYNNQPHLSWLSGNEKTYIRTSYEALGKYNINETISNISGKGMSR